MSLVKTLFVIPFVSFLYSQYVLFHTKVLSVIESFFAIFSTSAIEKNYRTVVCPIIDVIEHRTFSYKPGHAWTRGTFSWRFDYKERTITADQYLLRRDEADGVP